MEKVRSVVIASPKGRGNPNEIASFTLAMTGNTIVRKNQNGGNLIMKRLVGLVLGLFLVAGLAGIASAYNATGSSATIRVRCSIDAQLSVDVNTATHTVQDLGNIAVGGAMVITSSITVTNDSGGLTESYKLSATNASEVDGGGDVWTLADSTGPDTFAIRAIFGHDDAAPGNDDTNFSQVNDNLTATPAYADATRFYGDEGGYNVLYTAPIRPLWLRVLMPTSVKNAESHETVVTITAAIPQ